MSKNNSSGHLLNVNNFNVMISRIITFGEAFQPSRESLTVQGLQSLLKKSEDTLASVSAAEVNEMNIIAARQNAFQPLDSLVTRSISALRITDVLPETLAQAESMVRELRAIRVSATQADEASADQNAATKQSRTNTVHNSSFVRRADNFESYVLFLAGKTPYNPNEPDLTIASLTQKAAGLKKLNKDVVDAKSAVKAARRDRNITLYEDGTGMVDIASAVKQYVKSVFGVKTVQYKLINEIAFKKVKDE